MHEERSVVVAQARLVRGGRVVFSAEGYHNSGARARLSAYSQMLIYLVGQIEVRIQRAFEGGGAPLASSEFLQFLQRRKARVALASMQASRCARRRALGYSWLQE